MNNISIGTGYLYTLWTGALKITEGEVYQNSRDERLGSFKTRTTRYLTSIYPGVVYNGGIWLSERDDKLAIELLIAYEENAMLLLEDKIINHRTKITNLTNIKKSIVE